MKLAEEKCKPDATVKQLSKKDVDDLAPQVPNWSLANNEIRRDFKFKDFRQSMDFVNRIAEVANEQDHHPDIFISYNKVKLVLTTHKVGGLSMNDFILAAKIDFLAGGKPAVKAA